MQRRWGKKPTACYGSHPELQHQSLDVVEMQPEIHYRISRVRHSLCLNCSVLIVGCYSNIWEGRMGLCGYGYAVDRGKAVEIYVIGQERKLKRV